MPRGQKLASAISYQLKAMGLAWLTLAFVYLSYLLSQQDRKFDSVGFLKFSAS